MSCWLHELPCNPEYTVYLEGLSLYGVLAVHRQVPCIHVTLGLFRDCLSFSVQSVVFTKNASGMPANLEPIWSDCLFTECVSLFEEQAV